jgi:hypothetical protein
MQVNRTCGDVCYNCFCVLLKHRLLSLERIIFLEPRNAFVEFTSPGAAYWQIYRISKDHSPTTAIQGLQTRIVRCVVAALKCGTPDGIECNFGGAHTEHHKDRSREVTSRVPIGSPTHSAVPQL